MVAMTAMVTVMVMMLPPPPPARRLMTIAVPFKDGNWMTAIEQQRWDNDGVRQ